MFRIKRKAARVAAILKWRLKAAFRGLAVRNFSLRGVNRNMIVLLGLQKGERLVADFRGGLSKLNNKRSIFFYRLKNVLLWGNPEKRVVKAVECTLNAFCHEAKNPLDRFKLDLVKNKTVGLAEDVINRLSELNMHPEVIHAIEGFVKKYQIASIVQERILKSISKRVQRSSRTSRLWIEDDLKSELEKNPLLPKSGCSGSYIIHGKKRAIAGIFKPFDEEIGAPNNPTQTNLRGIFGGRIPGYGTRNGEGVHREVAAYLVDKFLGLRIVPETFYVEFTHCRFYDASQGKFFEEKKKKQGSFQEYIIGYKQIQKLSNKEVENIPVDQFHRLILLDLIIGNMDRNVSNLLTNGRKIKAIDHALSFPERHMMGRMHQWSNILQMRMAFFPSLYDKLNTLPVDTLCARLKKQCFIDECCLQRLRERVALLQESARRGMSPRQIILIMSDANLNQLKDLSATLHHEAARIVQQYISGLEEKRAKERSLMPCLS